VVESDAEPASLAAWWLPGPAVASTMRAFRACPISQRRAPRRVAADRFSRLLNGQNSLVAGKNAGNFVDSAALFKHPSRKHLQIQRFVDELPKRAAIGGETGRSVSVLDGGGDPRQAGSRKVGIATAPGQAKRYTDSASASIASATERMSTMFKTSLRALIIAILGTFLVASAAVAPAYARIDWGDGA
jgi:hypothetical protein